MPAAITQRPVTQPVIVGLGGSPQRRSASLAALDIALEGARAGGAFTERLALGDLDLPLYRPDEDPPPAALHLADRVAGADGLIWSTPLYHGSMSGAMKNALDWLQLLADHDPPYLTDKPVGLIATAGGVQALQAINSMEFVVRALRGWAIPFVVPVSHAAAAAGDAAFAPHVAGQLRTLGRETTSVAERLRTTPRAGLRAAG